MLEPLPVPHAPPGPQAGTTEGLCLGVSDCRPQEGHVGRRREGAGVGVLRDGVERYKRPSPPLPWQRAVPAWECSLLSTPAHSKAPRARRASSPPGRVHPAPVWWCQPPEKEGVWYPSGPSENGMGPCPGSLSSLQSRGTHSWGGGGVGGSRLGAAPGARPGRWVAVPSCPPPQGCQSAGVSHWLHGH